MTLPRRFPRFTTRLLALGTTLVLISCGTEPGPPGPGPGTGGTVGTGGVPSGGSPGSRGAGTGGVSTGGVSTGGVSTGGVSTGGVSTGGVSSGGVSSGGGTGTGGAGSGGDTGTGGDSPGTGGSGGFVLPTEPNSIAYTGCSMANNIGTGYKRVGGTIMWNADNYQTGAMVVQNWVDPNSSSWQLFDQKMNANGGIDAVKAIMVQICVTSDWPSDDEIKSMINSAREHVNPGTHIFIVGQPIYTDNHDCFIAGNGGEDWADEKAQEMAADPSINENMSYLGQFILDANNGEVSDGCHASNPQGEDVLGNQAKAFFGG